MDEILTVEEMKARYPDEWVIIGDPETDEHLHVLSGRVLCHSKDRDEVGRYAMTHRPKRFASLYLGEPPPGMEFVL
jgi:hypothetical protein